LYSNSAFCFQRDFILVDSFVTFFFSISFFAQLFSFLFQFSPNCGYTCVCLILFDSGCTSVTFVFTHTAVVSASHSHSLHRYYWLDAGWFVGGFPAGVGNWEIPLSAGVNRAQYVTPHLPPLQTEDTSASILYRLSFSITLITLTILDWCGRNTRNPLWKF
jgi:hypothetical protein